MKKHRLKKTTFCMKVQLQVPGPQHSVTAEIYQPWLEAVDSSAESLLEADVELDLHLAGGEVLDHGDHVHDQRLEIEQEAVRRKDTSNEEQFIDNNVEQDLSDKVDVQGGGRG